MNNLGYVKVLKREEQIPDPPRGKMYRLYRSDNFIAYRPLKDGELLADRDSVEDWYFEFNRLASDEQIHEEFAKFLKLIRPKKLLKTEGKDSRRSLKRAVIES
jgi:hypothetical protein